MENPASSSKTIQPPWAAARLYPRPHLPLPQLHGVLVPFDGSSGGCLPRPAVPLEQPPHRCHRQAHPQPAADHSLHPDQGPPLIGEAVRGRPLAEFLLEHGELGIGDGRGVRRACRAQGFRPALTPGPAPAFHRPHAHPQILGDHRGLLTCREPLTGLEPDPFTKHPTLSGQAPTLRITHTNGIPQGSPTVTTRRQAEILSNAAEGGLKPPPERRLRRANHPSSPVQHHAQLAATTADLTRSWDTSPW
jgi:hypothetical protein